MWKTLLFSLAVLLCLLSCTAIPETNQDPAKNNRATFRKDLMECKEDYSEAGSGVHIREWEGCMKLKGWR